MVKIKKVPVQIVANVEKISGLALKTIDDLAKKETEQAKTELYSRASEWFASAVEASRLPDSFIDSAEKDWTKEVEGRKISDDYSQLEGKVEGDLKRLIAKYGAYESLLKDGEALIADIMTEGLVKKDKAEQVDYGLLSLVEPMAQIGAQVMGSTYGNEWGTRFRGYVSKKVGGKLGGKLMKAGKKLGDSIKMFSVVAGSSSGAADIAKNDLELKTKIPLKDGKTLLSLAYEEQTMNNLSEGIEKLVNEKKITLLGCQYVEVRFDIDYGQLAYAFDGKLRGSGEGMNLQFGVKVMAEDGGINGRGDVGGEFSLKEFDTEGKGYLRLAKAIESAHEMAIANAHEKVATAKKYCSQLTESITETGMAPAPPVRKKVKAKYGGRIHPMVTDIREIIADVKKISKKVERSSPTIKKNIVYAILELKRSLFVNSDGSNIYWELPRAEGGFFAVAQDGEGKMPGYTYNSIAGIGGFEVLNEGKNGQKKTLSEFVLNGAETTVKMAAAEFLPEELTDGSGMLNVYEKDGKLYTDGTIVPTGKAPQKGMKQQVLITPSAGVLPNHENGPSSHANELDRAGGEAGNYAGGTIQGNWFDSMIGKRVASQLISAYIEPFYPFDDQGVETEKQWIVEKGILKNFQNDRETALKFRKLWNIELPLTGSSRATAASNVPLIRMSYNVIEDGDTSPEEMVKMMGKSEGETGWIAYGCQTPSITAGRTHALVTMNLMVPVMNGKIVYDKETGKPKVYRGGAIAADSKDMWDDDVRAVGNDGEEWYVFNCGKGKGGEMQTQYMFHKQPSILTRTKVRPGYGASMAMAEIDFGSYIQSRITMGAGA